MDDESLYGEKLDPALLEIIRSRSSEQVPVIVQTIDGLKDDDRRVVDTLGGRIKDDLYIINAFSADMTVAAITSLILSPRVVRIYYDAPVKAF